MLRRIASAFAITFILGSTANSPAQTPKLLQETADHYKGLDAYEFDGVMDIRLPGTGWRANANVTLLFPKKGSLPSNSPLNAEIRQFSRSSQVRIGPTNGKPFPRFSYPRVGSFDEITKSMLSAKDTGDETLQLNGKPVLCEIWRVRYSTTDEHPHDTPITFWIDPISHMVLRESVIEKLSPQIQNAVFTTTFHEAKFGVPTPKSVLDWAAQIATKSDVTERTDWIGKPAPDFTLRSTSGETVKLPSLHGRSVLLDFWAIYCAPCRREMPIVENLAKEYRTRGVEVFGVSPDDAEKARRWLSKNNHTLVSLVDSDYQVSDRYKVRGVPSLVLIGPDGKISRYWEGPVAKDALQAALEKIQRE